MDIDLPVVAGTMSTLVFVVSALPMLGKAYRTKDLASYSAGNILLANAGNVVHSAYVFSLPPGPIWALHTFYLVTTGMMLFWYLRYEGLPAHRGVWFVSPIARSPSRSRSIETPVPIASPQKNGPSPNSEISERAIAKAKTGPSVSGPVVTSRSALSRMVITASPAIASISPSGRIEERSVAIPEKRATSRTTPLAI